MAKPDKPLTARRISSLWQTTPSMIEWLQRERKSAQKIDTTFGMLHQGINSSIVLLSASCIEGFLVECLQSFEFAFHAKDTFEKRLRHDYYERVSKSTFNEISGFFTIALGKSLSELMKKKPIHKDIEILFRFRNGLAHGRSVEHRSYSEYGSDQSTWEFETWGSYKIVEQYLIEKELCSKEQVGKQDLFSNGIADHFAALIEPYIRDVVSILPKEQADQMRVPLVVTLKEKPKWK